MGKYKCTVRTTIDLEKGACFTHTKTHCDTKRPTDDSSEEMREQMYLQLHEQYANNYYQSISGIGAILVALLATYGYYVSKTFEMYSGELKSFSVVGFCILFAAVSFVSALIFCICVSQGASQRIEQIIVYGIRKTYQVDKDHILPDSYTPFKKSDSKSIEPKGMWDFIPGLYDILSKAVVVAYIFALGLFYLVYHKYISMNYCNHNYLFIVAIIEIVMYIVHVASMICFVNVIAIGSLIIPIALGVNILCVVILFVALSILWIDVKCILSAIFFITTITIAISAAHLNSRYEKYCKAVENYKRDRNKAYV